MQRHRKTHTYLPTDIEKILTLLKCANNFIFYYKELLICTDRHNVTADHGGPSIAVSTDDPPTAADTSTVQQPPQLIVKTFYGNVKT